MINVEDSMWSVEGLSDKSWIKMEDPMVIVEDPIVNIKGLSLKRRSKEYVKEERKIAKIQMLVLWTMISYRVWEIFLVAIVNYPQLYTRASAAIWFRTFNRLDNISNQEVWPMSRKSCKVKPFVNHSETLNERVRELRPSGVLVINWYKTNRIQRCSSLKKRRRSWVTTEVPPSVCCQSRWFMQIKLRLFLSHSF